MPAPARPLDVITHVAHEGPGAIADRAESQGFVVRRHDLWANDPVPDVDEIERLVVMGGPMGANDDALLPQLATERELLLSLATRGIPVLGICLGAQLVAAALGAEVRTGPEPEIGSGSVAFTDKASDDAILGPVARTSPSLPVFHWHRDTFDLPVGAVLLASSRHYLNQAFRVGPVWGLQFHIELRAVDGPSVRSHLEAGYTVSDEALAATEKRGRPIIDAFLCFVPDQPPDGGDTCAESPVHF